MKKCDLATLAMIGISAGLIVGGCQQSSKDKKDENGSSHKSTDGEQITSDMQAFYSSLSPDAQKKFKELDAQHKIMAMEMANQQCNGQNKCAGMGGCATSESTCAGKNGCKGQGGAPVENLNKAVEVQYKNQTSKKDSSE